jgi:tetratricopeptide (TPR) repeat protein
MVYVDFELELGPGPRPGAYGARVLRAVSGGEPQVTFTLDVDELVNRCRSLETTILASAACARGPVVPELERPLRQVGAELFRALFAGPIGNAYRASLTVARERGKRLRVVLRITAPELAVMPWEALYDDELQAYICRNEQLVRHIDAPYTPEPLPVRPPLRILGIVASPKGLPELNVDAEIQRLEQALASPIAEGQVQVEWLRQGSWSSVHERLLQGPWHVLHFIGHGDYDPERAAGRIALVRDDGRAKWIDAASLADLVAQADPTPRLMVLNSCASGQVGSQDLFSGTAATLVHRGISAVAAMQFSVSDSAAVAFPRGFYAALARGRSVDEAVGSGRIEILGAGDGTLEWVTPVLHVRGEPTRLFELIKRPPSPTPSPPAVAEVRPDLRSDPEWTDALSAYFDKRWAEAVERFEPLEARYPDEGRVQTRLKEARRRRDIDSWSSKAEAAAADSDWGTVVTALENLAALDPTYPDVGARLEQARIAQRRKELVDEMTALHQAGRWQAVVAAAQELGRLDPENPDPGGIVSDAQAKIREADLADRFARALNHLDDEDWQQAAELFAAIEQEQPGYRDAAALRVVAERGLRELDLAEKYHAATEAQTSGDWATAATIFGEIVATDSDYRDADTRRLQCETAQSVAELQNRLRHHADNGDCQAVIDVSAEVAKLDPAAADPDGSVERACDLLGSKPQQPSRQRGSAASKRPNNEPEPVSSLSKPSWWKNQSPPTAEPLPQSQAHPPPGDFNSKAALVFGIVAVITSWLLIGAIFGLIAVGVGIAAYRGDQPTSRGKAIVGVALGAWAILIAIVIIAMNAMH